MLFWDGYKMVNKPETVQVERKEQPLPVYVPPAISLGAVHSAIRSGVSVPRQSWVVSSAPEE